MFFSRSHQFKSAIAGLIVLGLAGGLAACGDSSDSRQRNAIGEVAVPCTLGGRGPTGGVVVSLASSTSGTSVESAPANWTPMPQTNWAEMTKRAREYRAGGFSDWKLPTIEQMDALGNPLIQFIGGKTFWSSTEVSRSTYAWYWRGYRDVADQTTGADASGSTMQAIPVRNFIESSTPCMAEPVATTTSTTIVPQDCSAGGLCKVGDIGTGGGVVFSAVIDAAGNTAVLEAAPADWAVGTTSPVATLGTLSARPPLAFEDNAAAVALAYRGGNKTDWRLPNASELTTLCNTKEKPLGTASYWVAGNPRTDGFNTYNCTVNLIVPMQTRVYIVRPVRNYTVSDSVRKAALQYYAANPTTTSSNVVATTTSTTSTTIAPTTTGATANCASGGSCAVGDTGPGGGIVFYASPTPINSASGISNGGKYLEAAPNTWSGGTSDPALPWCDKTTTTIGNSTESGQGASNTKRMVAACNSTSAANVVANLTLNKWDDWFLPSGWELSFMWQNRDKIGGFNNSVAYWSSSEVPGNVAKGAQRLIFNPVRWIEDTKAGNYLVRPIRAFSEGAVPPKANTQVVANCASGGSCAVGDTGPGGGRVFYVSPSRMNAVTGISSGGKYLEAAPNTWNGGTADPTLPWCDKTTTMIGNPSGLGEGAANTKRMIDACSSNSAAEVVADLFFNNRDDWFLPSAEELSFMWRSRDVIGGFNNSVAYWSSSEVPGNVAKAVQRLVFNPVKWLEDTKVGNYLVRPIRAFSEGDVPAVAPATTIPATTTTSTIPLAPACASISSCKVGERGPGDSIIISATFEGPTSRYLAIARDGWNGTLIDPKMTLAEAKTAVAAYKPNGQTGWTLPSYLDKLGYMGQILQLCRYAHNYMPETSASCFEDKPLRSNWSVPGDDMSYWTSHPTAPSGADGYGAIMRVRDGSVWGSLLGTRNYVRPVLEFSYTAPPIPTTTTTVPQKCAQGGVCKIGDVSPTGGLIVKFFGSGSNITYTEIAPRNWDASIAGLNNSNGDEPLAKYASASGVAQQFRGGGKTDWHLPDIAEMRDAFTATQAPTFSAATEKNGQRSCKVTSSAGMTNADQWGFYANYWISGRSPLIFSYPTGGVYPVVDSFDVSASEWQHSVRPVRTGKYTGPSMSYKNPTYSPAECETVAMATTTTTPTTRTCAQGGPCRVGDVGQRGGIVISVDNSKPRGQRNVEMAKFGWKFGRDDCAGTSFGFPCNTGEWDPIAAGSIGDGYRLPTVAELQAVSRLPSATRNQLQLIDHYYWTSESSGKNMNVKLALDSGIGVDDKNKLRREPNATNSYSLVDAHWAVKISTGFTVSETYAYTRPVRAF